ncbi:uncharacterized protein LOC111050264 [Nilaparvata lugens]|uniref:uncharacterized protein LOC111050264 n=1 Tax=Nilaparvata lugens TaxID=108931 RepID=UPI00193E357A|nr:uncharacterized protein LOC111050264 [Nilaparvata lugens]
MNYLSNMYNERYRFSIISGICACSSSLFGKLSGKIPLDSSYYLVLIKAVFILLMFVSGAAVWTYYVKALQRSTTTIVPTLISTATNYILSAICGCLIFGEQLTILWFCGMVLVTSGLMLVTKSTMTDSEHLMDKNAENKPSKKNS